MKKKFLSIPVLAVVLILLSCKSSSSSFESDVRKMAAFLCKTQKLQAKNPTDEKVTKELEDIQKEMMAYGSKMEEKYKDKKGNKEMEEKAEAIMKEEMAKCK